VTGIFWYWSGVKVAIHKEKHGMRGEQSETFGGGLMKNPMQLL
jgi:hypothetical protein